MGVALQSKKWRINHPEKSKAYRIVFVNVRNGKLKPKPCEMCGNEKSESHHKDYSKPLEVIWLCKKHHMLQHKREKDVIHRFAFDR